MGLSILAALGSGHSRDRCCSAVVWHSTTPGCSTGVVCIDRRADIAGARQAVAAHGIPRSVAGPGYVYFAFNPVREFDVKTLHAAAAAFAYLGGALLLFITALTCVSVIGRNTTGWSVDGDFELVSFASGAALALCVPWCQLRRGNIIVDFFTARASAAVQDTLDRIGALCFALFMAVCAWRGSVGGVNAWQAQSGSMMLGFPDWVVYALLVPGLTLAAIVAFYQGSFGFVYQESTS